MPPSPRLPQPYESSGVGGKFRKHNNVRKSSQSTPYDRPSSATRPATWLSKLIVDPASKLRIFGAHRFFSWVFSNKRLPPPPPPPAPRPSDEEHERRNGLQGTALDVKINAGVQESVADVCGTSSSNNDTGGLPALEHLLKQKTFTRYEIDRLTELLKSRAAESPVEDDRHGFQLNPCGQDSEIHQEFPATLNINTSECLGAHKAVLDLAVTTREQDMQQHLGDEIASPAELAKSYMSNRPAKVPSSTMGSLSQTAKVPLSQLSASPVKTSYSGVPMNGFTTPRTRGKSAIYNMAHTPFSRFHPLTHQKVCGSKNYCDSRPPLFASRSALENGGQVSLKPMGLKRRSTVLDDDNGSIGPVRRIRQKHNLLPHGKSVTISGKGIGSDFTHSPNPPFMGSADTRRASTSRASYAHVPRESSEMAAKILEHLEKMTAKAKSPESKLAAAREGSTFKPTPHMLRGQALKSMEDLGASKLLQDSLKDHKLVDQPVRSLPKPESHEFTSQKQGSLEEHGPVKSVNPEVKFTPDRIVQGSDNTSLGYGAMRSFSSQPPEKKLPFKMSAHEDWINMDDDHCNDHVPESAEKGMVKSTRDTSAFNEDKTLDKSPVTLERIHSSFVLSRTELEGGNVMANGKTSGFNFPTPFAPNTRSQKVISQPTEVDDSPLLVSSGSETTRNNPTSVDPKVGTLSSLKNTSFGATNAVVGVAESDTSGTKNSELDNTVNGNLGKPPSLSFNPISTNNIISVDAPSSNLASNGGPLTSSACLSFSSSAPATVNFTSKHVTNNSSNMASSAGVTTSTSILSDSLLVPANGAYSSFSKGVSDNSSSKNLFSPPTIESREATDVKAENVNGLCNFSNSATVNTSGGTSTGSSILGVGSTSTVNSQWPSSACGTTVSNESSLTGFGSDTVSMSIPVHFGSSSSAMGFGLSGATPLTSSSIFNSSVPATKSEDVTKSSTSASASNPVNPINVAASVMFKFGGGASASTEGNTFGSTTTGSLGAFQFGATSATPTSSRSSPSSSIFSFGAGSSAATSVSNSTSGAFNFAVGTSVSSSSANPLISSSSTAPAIFSFGSSASAPSSESNKVTPFSMPSSTGFSFGGSSPAFGTSNSSMVFGSTTTVPSNPTFSFSAATSSPLTSVGIQSVFGNTPSPFTTTPGNNDQMGVEDCMAEDPIQSSTPAAPVFTQSLVSPQPVVSPSPPGFMFASTAPSSVAPFQFASQQSQVGQQNPSQFQASASSEFNPAEGFSLGSGGDKSGRRYVKVSNKSRNRKLR